MGATFCEHRVTLTAESVGGLRKYIPASRNGILIPSERELFADQVVYIDMRLGTSEIYDVPLVGRVIAESTTDWTPDGQRVYRVALSPGSWSNLYDAVSWLPARRSEDTHPDGARTCRRPADSPASCYVASLWQRFDARLLDLSDTGAFLAIDAEVDRGDFVWFRGSGESAWHGATVRWRGTKSSRDGIGVALTFDRPGDRERWLSYLAYHE